MENNSNIKDYRSFTSFKPDRCGKSTLFENEYILLGLNCLEPGQSMEKHAHEVQNRYYVVMEGNGCAWVGENKNEIAPGMVIWVPSGCTHRLENSGADRLVLMVGITPPHAD